MIKLEDAVLESASGGSIEGRTLSELSVEKPREVAAYSEELRKQNEKSKNAISLFLAFAHYLENKDIWPTT